MSLSKTVFSRRGAVRPILIAESFRRLWRIPSLLALVFFLNGASAFAETNAAALPGDVDSSFTANLYAPVISGNRVAATLLTRQPDGKIIVIGSFAHVNNLPRRNLARINADGTPDATFNPQIAYSEISSIAVQADGKILLGGDFVVNLNGINSTTGMIRLNADGSTDADFRVANGSNQAGAVRAISVLPDGKIIIAGAFNSVNNFPVNRLARLHADGSLDLSFQTGTGPDNSVEAIAAQPDGKIIIGGDFNAYNSFSRRGLARINADGSLDAGFNAGTGVNNDVAQIIIQPDGKILLGGNFNSVNGIDRRSGIARLESNGTLDSAFAPDVGFLNTFQTRIVLQADGKVLAGFEILFGTTNFRRFNADGTTDNSFVSVVTSPIRAILPESDGKIVIGGDFSQVNGAARNGLARVNANGSTDASFGLLLNFSAPATKVAVQPDGKILIVGGFQFVNGTPKSGFVRLRPDGAIDESFATDGFSNNGFSGISALAPLADGKILIAGGFQTVNGQPINRLARLRADGSLDPDFNIGTGPDNPISLMGVQSDGKIILAGIFTSFNGINYRGIVRLNPNGSVDQTFTPPFAQFGFAPLAITVQPDNKILLGGSFYLMGGSERRGVIRLNADGTLDAGFNTSSDNSFVYTIVAQPDGKILVGGSFQVFNGITRRNVTRLNDDGSVDLSFSPRGGANNTVNDIALEPSGKMWIGGAFTQVNGSQRLLLARLNADGSLDSFDLADDGASSALGNSISTLARQADGRLIVGGAFSRLGGVNRVGVARVNPPRAAFAPLYDFDGDGKTDYAVFRPSSGAWYHIESLTGNAGGRLFGVPTDRIVPADFDGDRKTDLAVWRPATGQWFILRSGSGDLRVEQFGANGDIPVPADFDGDGRDDLAVFRPANGTWYLRQSSQGFKAVPFGADGDVPVIGDFDGDYKSDLAVFRPANGTWYLNRSAQGFSGIQFGDGGDIPVPGDFDGDGRTDVAVFRPANGTWYLNRSTQGFTAVQFGAGGDKPVVGDYDGDNRADIAIFRPADGTWFSIFSASGAIRSQIFGASGDVPVPAAFTR